MKKLVSITEAVAITKNRVKPFIGEKRYLATGDLIGDEIDDPTLVDYKTKPSRADLLVHEGEIILARMQATNKVFLIDKTNKDLIISTGFLTLMPQKGFDADYLFYYFRSDIFQRQKDRYCSGATQKAINNGAFKKLLIPHYSLEEQKKIARILNHADSIHRKRKKSTSLLNELLDVTFLDMCGDPINNNKKWEKVELDSISEIQGGVQVTAKRKPNPIEVPYLRVANVYRDKLALDEIKTIRVTSSELVRTTLKKGDILIVEGHGNQEEIGRTAVWNGSINPCVHQNHLIRIRVDTRRTNPLYISSFLNSAGGKSQLFKMRKTTSGLNTISSSNVKSLNIILPPLDIQKKYVTTLIQIEKIKLKIDQSKVQMKNQLNALMQKAFGEQKSV